MKLSILAALASALFSVSAFAYSPCAPFQMTGYDVYANGHDMKLYISDNGFGQIYGQTQVYNQFGQLVTNTVQGNCQQGWGGYAQISFERFANGSVPATWWNGSVQVGWGGYSQMSGQFTTNPGFGGSRYSWSTGPAYDATQHP